MKRFAIHAGLVLAFVLLFTGCRTYEPPEASVAGMVHTDFSGSAAPDLNIPPAYVTGYVVLDTDQSITNGYSQAIIITIATGSLLGTEGIRYCFEKVPAGSYFVYMILDTNGDGSLDMTAGSGDSWGFYGSRDFSDPAYIPPSANLVVGNAGYWTCDFWARVQVLIG